MRKGVVRFQIGKNGVTENFVNTIRLAFNNRKTLKINVLRSAVGERGDMEKIADELVRKLGKGYVSKVLGFTVVLRRSMAVKR